MLAEVGSGLLLGSVVIACSRLMTAAEQTEHAQVLRRLNYKVPYAWVLEEPVALEQPITIPGSVRRATVQWITRKRWKALVDGAE